MIIMECGYNKKKLGNKAYYLYLLEQTTELCIPNSVAIGPKLFEECLKYNLNKDNNLKRIISTIDDWELPELKYDTIKKIISYFEQEDYLIVRSSFENEDTINNSNAGQYESYGFVKVTILDIWKNIKKVWKSYFINLSYHTNKLHFVDLSILIQPIIEGDYLGVAFSRNPITFRREPIIEGSRVTENSVVNGGSNHFTLYKTEDVRNKISENTDFKNEYKIKLLEILSCLDNMDLFNASGVDIEWIVKNGIVYLLQARNITAGKPIKEDELFTFIDMDSNQVHLYNWPPFYQNLINTHYKKRYWMKKLVNNNPNITYTLGFLILKQDFFENGDFDNLKIYMKKFIKSKYVYIMYQLENEKQDLVFTIDEFLSYIQNHRHQSQDLIFWVTEFHMPKISGLSNKSEDGKFMIEYIKGDLAGLKFSSINFSFIIIDKNKETIEENIKYCDEYFGFINNKSMKLKNKDRFPLYLPNIIKEEIINCTNIISRKYPNATLEWICDENGLFKIYDMSTSKEYLQKQEIFDLNIISSGDFKGTLVYINADTLDSLLMSSFTDVSIKSYREEEIEHKNNKKVNDLINRLSSFENKPIIYSEYPAPMFSYLTDYCSGFIFKRGAILGHLGIILRERHIPAITTDKELQEGDMYRIVKGEIYSE